MTFTTPIEMPRGSHYGSDFYTVYSVKAGRVVNLFSKLEYYNFLALETDPNVETFCEQPCEIQIVEDGKAKKAIFDMWVRYKDGREELQEVKYSKELTGNSKSAIRSQEQIRRQKHWCEDNGIPFVVRTEAEIIDGQFSVPNRQVIANLVRRYNVDDSTEYYKKLVIRTLDDADYDKKTLKIADLLLGEKLPIGQEWMLLCYLYVNGVIDLNIKNRPLDARLEVTLCRSM